MELKSVEIENERVYLRKGWLGWRVVEPVILKVNDKWDWSTWNWKNFVSKRGLFTLGYILILMLFLYLAFQEQINNYQIVMNSPCQFCETCQEYARGLLQSVKSNNLIVNITNIKL